MPVMAETDENDAVEGGQDAWCSVLVVQRLGVYLGIDFVVAVAVASVEDSTPTMPENIGGETTPRLAFPSY